MSFEPLLITVPSTSSSKFQIASVTVTPKAFNSLRMACLAKIFPVQYYSKSPGNKRCQTTLSTTPEPNRNSESMMNNYNKIRKQQKLLPMMMDQSKKPQPQWFISNQPKKQKMQLLTDNFTQELKVEKEFSIHDHHFHTQESDYCEESKITNKYNSNIPSRRRLGIIFDRMQKQQSNLIKGKLIKQLSQKHQDYLQFCSSQSIPDIMPHLSSFKGALVNSQRKIVIPTDKLQQQQQLQQDSPKEIKGYKHYAKLKFAPKGFLSNKEPQKEISVNIPKLESKLENFENYKLNINVNQKREKYKLYEIIKKNIFKLKKLKRLQLGDQVFSQKPFEKENSKQFIMAAKKNDYVSCKQFLETNRYLTFDFDYFSMTALHWTCKKGHLQTTKLLFDYDLDIDAEDIVGRTPLYLAIQNGNNEIAKLLLYHHASPWSTDRINYNELLKTNPQAKQILSLSRKQKYTRLIFYLDGHQKNCKKLFGQNKLQVYLQKWNIYMIFEKEKKLPFQGSTNPNTLF